MENSLLNGQMNINKFYMIHIQIISIYLVQTLTDFIIYLAPFNSSVLMHIVDISEHL